MTQPTDNEINEVLNWCAESEDNGNSNYPGMTYEQGVDASIRWMKDEGENPSDE